MKTFKLNRIKMLAIASAFFIATITASCGKDGDMGPKGDTGATGSAGSQGIPGTAGALIISGTGAPAAATGNNGDMYLDKNTSNLYGPKTAAGWGTPLALKGDTGQTGASGSAILNGTTEPTTVGVNGDYYLNKTNADLYGPKTAAGWGTPINLKGSANVVASTWFKLRTWNNNGLNFYRDASYDIPSPVLNAVGYTSLGQMLDKGGSFMVYFNYLEWSYQVPATLVSVVPHTYVNWIISNNVNSNSFLFSVYGENNSALNTDLINNPGNGSYKIRYVLIPAGSQFTISGLKNKSYEEVKELLKLRD